MTRHTAILVLFGLLVVAGLSTIFIATAAAVKRDALKTLCTARETPAEIVIECRKGTEE